MLVTSGTRVLLNHIVTVSGNFVETTKQCRGENDQDNLTNQSSPPLQKQKCVFSLRWDRSLTAVTPRRLITKHISY